MKILFYNHTGQVSGAERMLLMILTRLDRRLFDPVVVCPEQGPLRKMAMDLDVPVQVVAALEARFTKRPDRLLSYFRSFFLVIRQFRRKVACAKPDMIHANSIRSGLVATAATLGLGTRVVWHLHDLLPRHSLSIGVRVFAFLCGRTQMIAVSRAVAENFCGAVYGLGSGLRKRTTIVLNAIELEKFQPNQIARQRVRDELKLDNYRPVIGVVGQLTPRKGQLELIRAFARVLSRSPRAVLLVIGAPLFNQDHEYEQLLRDTARQLGISDRVLLLGARSDVAAIMAALDLLVINSSAEPFGLVALEAMACGTPVVAAACDGLTEIIDHGVDGWLVPTGDEETLAAAIVNLGSQPALCARLAEEGKKKVTAHFSADKYLAELQTYYCSVLELKSKTTVVGSSTRLARESTKFAELAEP